MDDRTITTLAALVAADLARAAETLSAYLAWVHDQGQCRGDEGCPGCLAERDYHDAQQRAEDEAREAGEWDVGPGWVVRRE